MPLDKGSLFAGYQIDRLIGRGGMGEVYLARHRVLDRLVALKVVADHLAGDESFRERFLSESRLAASLDHPNVVTVYEAGEADRQLYLAMRYVDVSVHVANAKAKLGVASRLGLALRAREVLGIDVGTPGLAVSRSSDASSWLGGELITH